MGKFKKHTKFISACAMLIVSLTFSNQVTIHADGTLSAEEQFNRLKITGQKASVETLELMGIYIGKVESSTNSTSTKVDRFLMVDIKEVYIEEVRVGVYSERVIAFASSNHSKSTSNTDSTGQVYGTMTIQYTSYEQSPGYDKVTKISGGYSITGKEGVRVWGQTLKGGAQGGRINSSGTTSTGSEVLDKNMGVGSTNGSSGSWTYSPIFSYAYANGGLGYQGFNYRLSVGRKGSTPSQRWEYRIGIEI